MSCESSVQGFPRTPPAGRGCRTCRRPLTIHSSRSRFAARLNSGVRPRMRHIWLLALALSGCAHAAQSTPDRFCLELAYSLHKPAPPPKLSSLQMLPRHIELTDLPHALATSDWGLKQIHADLAGIRKPVWPLARAGWSGDATDLEINWGSGLSGHSIHLKRVPSGTYVGAVTLYSDIPTPESNISELYLASATRVKCK